MRKRLPPPEWLTNPPPQFGATFAAFYRAYDWVRLHSPVGGEAEGLGIDAEGAAEGVNQRIGPADLAVGDGAFIRVGDDADADDARGGLLVLPGGCALDLAVVGASAVADDEVEIASVGSPQVGDKGQVGDAAGGGAAVVHLNAAPVGGGGGDGPQGGLLDGVKPQVTGKTIGTAG